MPRRSLWFAVVIVTLSLSHAANAATTFLTNRATFLSAFQLATNIDFETAASPGSYAAFEGATLSGVTFTSDSGLLLAIDGAYYPPYYDWNSGVTAASYFYGDPLKAALPAGQYAVGADVMIADYDNGGVSEEMFARVTLADSSTVTQSITTFAMPGRAFMGFFSDQPITEIRFWTPDIQFGDGPNYYPFPLVDNLLLAVPEPGSLAAIATMSLALLRRRR